MPKKVFLPLWSARARASASKARLIIPNKEDGRRLVCVRPDKGQRRRAAQICERQNAGVKSKVQRDTQTRRT